MWSSSGHLPCLWLFSIPGFVIWKGSLPGAGSPPMVSDSRYPIWGEQMFLQASPGSFMQHHLRIFTYLFKVPFVFKLQGKQGSRCSLPTSCLALDMLGACLSCFLPCCDKNLTEPTSGRGFFGLPIQNHSSSCQGKAQQPKWLVQWWQDLVL